MPDLLICVDIYSQIIEPNIINKGLNFPVTQKTLLAWIFFGIFIQFEKKQKEIRSFEVKSMNTVTNFNVTLKSFWQLEEFLNHREYTLETKGLRQYMFSSQKRRW